MMTDSLTKHTILSDATMLSTNSKNITTGGVFLAVKGTKTDGTKYIQEAIWNGARTIITHTDAEIPAVKHPVRIVKNANPRRYFAQLASAFYQPQPRHISAVTGTNGKTFVANLVQQIWSMFQRRAAAIGTLGVTAIDPVNKTFTGETQNLPTPGKNSDRGGGAIHISIKNTATSANKQGNLGKSRQRHISFYDCNLTTPDPITLHKTIAFLKKNQGIDNVCIEASSHGIAMHRLDGLSLKCAGFTNLSRDHLDYHGTMKEYFLAKSRLFSHLLSREGTAVLNASIPEYPLLRTLCENRGIKHISYGIKERCGSFTPDICVTNYTIRSGPQPGFDVIIDYGNHTIETQVPLPGLFQLENILCGVAMASTGGIHVMKILERLPNIDSVCGRLQYVASFKGAQIYVDYAHTPKALEAVLQAMKPHARNALWVIFGCGGDRDTKKRESMGDIATTFADKVIVTDDNPRGESPARIRKEILKGGSSAIEIGDRKMAIETAINGLTRGDVLIVAGKGHERAQIVGDIEHPFNDTHVIMEILKNQ